MREVMPTEADIIAALNELGKTDDEIADSLLRLGHKGNSEVCNCPIYHYLRQRFPDVGFRVSISYILIEYIDHDHRLHHISSLLSFVDKFDHGEYPALVA